MRFRIMERGHHHPPPPSLEYIPNCQSRDWKSVYIFRAGCSVSISPGLLVRRLCQSRVALCCHGLFCHQIITGWDVICSSLPCKKRSTDAHVQMERGCRLGSAGQLVLNVPVMDRKQQECWGTVGNGGGQLVSAGPAMHLHLSRVSSRRQVRSTWLGAPVASRLGPCGQQSEVEGWGGTTLCVSNLMTWRSLLSLACTPLTLIFFTPPLPISCAAHQSVLVSGLLLLLMLSTPIPSVDLPEQICLTSIILGNWARQAVGIWKEILFRTRGRQPGSRGFSLPHLTSQRFMWLDLLSFSNKKTFWPASCKFSELIFNEN